MTTIVSLKQVLKQYKYLMIVLLLLIIYFYKGNIINIFKSNDSYICITEDNIFNEKINFLEHELNEKELYASYNHDLTRLSYRKIYNTNEFYIYGGENNNYEINNILVNKDGVIGIINKVNDDYSECTLLTGLNNYTVVIKDSYGTIKEYQNNLFLIDNITNMDDIHLNDEVYSTSYGDNHNSYYVGYVYELINNHQLYMKSNVDFYNISYMYVIGNS